MLVLLATACAPSSDEGLEEESRDVGEAPPPADHEAGEGEERTPAPRAEEPSEAPDSPHVDAVGVSAGHPAAVDAGIDILVGGGNAVDAAIAAAFAMSVVEPFASGLGGGGAALLQPPGEEPLAYDYRDVVPASGEIPPGNTGVPGFLAGMAELHAEHGSGEFARLVEPAIALAEDGVETSESLAYWLRSGRVSPAGLEHLFPGGTALAEGDELRQSELAETLRTVAAHGAEILYDGALGEALAAEVGAIDTDSLAAYTVERPSPAVGAFAGYRVVSSAPPLAGATVIQLLQIAEAAGIAGHEPGSADHIHAMAMAWRIAERHLNADIADPAFTDVPVDELTDPERNAQLAEQIEPDAVVAGSPGARRADLAAGYGTAGLAASGAAHPAAGDTAHAAAGGPAHPAADGNTTHITTVDADGSMVAMTNTLSNFWGSGTYALGFFLNDQLRNFGNRPGSPNEPPEAGKRTVASSSPTILVDDDGRPVLGLGSPGGRRIPNILAGVLTGWALHDRTLAEAVEAPRSHGEGSTLVFEEFPPDDVLDDLRGRGHAGFDSPGFPYYFGSVQAMEIDYEADEVRGAADPRREADWRVETP